MFVWGVHRHVVDGRGYGVCVVFVWGCGDLGKM